GYTEESCCALRGQEQQAAHQSECAERVPAYQHPSQPPGSTAYSTVSVQPRTEYATTDPLGPLGETTIVTRRCASTIAPACGIWRSTRSGRPSPDATWIALMHSLACSRLSNAARHDRPTRLGTRLQ